MASAPPPPQPQHQSAPPAPRYNANSNIQSSSGGRSDGRGNYGGRGRGGGDGGGRGGYGRGAGGGRGGGNNYGNHPGGGRGAGRGGGNYNNNNSGPSTQQPRPANAVPYGYLPPYLPGASSLVEQLDRKLLVILRDGRHLVGTLLSFDQFSNMVMQETSERRILVVAKEKSEKNDENDVQPSTPKSICYQTDIELGLFVVRGDNVVLLGEVHDDEEEMNDGQIRFVSLEEFEQLEEEETKRKEESGEGDEAINWDFDMDLVA